MKLYQNALKLHSQGPAYLAEADAAYQELFKSEVFSYPESLSELKWLEAYGDVENDEDVEELSPEMSGPAIGADTTPSSLPQILYLAYKNYGQFRLDNLRYRLNRLEGELSADQGPQIDINRATNTGLEHLTEAVSRDETDLELWRTVSRLSEYLGSPRLARYCLESVLDDYDVLQSDSVATLSLDERFALNRLRSIISKLGDKAAEEELRMLFDGTKPLSKNLKNKVDPCPFLPENDQPKLSQLLGAATEVIEVSITAPSWISIGKALLQQIQQETQGLGTASAGARYRLVIPDIEGVQTHQYSPPQSAAPVPSPKATVASSRPQPKDQNSIPAADEAQDSTSVDSPVVNGFVHRKNDEPLPPTPVSAGLRVDGSEPNVDDPEAPTSTTQEAFPVAANHQSLPTRKRSSDEADIADPNDALRGRSKRIKARNETSEAGPGKGQSAEEWAKWYAKQLEIYERADNIVFQCTDEVASKLGCNKLGQAEDLRMVASRSLEASAQDDISSEPTATGISALKQLLDHWDPIKSRTFISGGGLQDPIKGAQVFGLTNFLEHSMQETSTTIQRPVLPSDTGLQGLVSRIQHQSVDSLAEYAIEWLLCLLTRKGDEYGEITSLYESHSWPDVLKETVVQTLVLLDEHIYSRIKRGYLDVPPAIIQSIFEIHLDVYGRITNPSSEVNQATRLLQQDRLCRWSDLAGDVIQKHAAGQLAVLDDIHLRFLWAMVICNNMLDKPSSEHSVLCYQDLIRSLRISGEEHQTGSRVIQLVNNAVMPEISTAVAEREISRITTMNFFATIFDSSDEDPFTVIDKLEPLLELSITKKRESAAETRDPEIRMNHDPLIHGQKSTLHEALRFLDRASISLKLFLWHRLRDAYGIINYPSMILSCNLRSLALIVDHLSSPIYNSMAQHKDIESFLQWMNKIDELLAPMIAVILTDVNAFDCIDDDHIRSLIDTVVSLRKILHVFAMWEDSIRVGQVSAPAQPGSVALKLQTKSAEKFREMIVKAWTLHYLFIREAMKQNSSLFVSSDEDLLNYLRLSHYALGLRTYCGLASKMFLKLAKSEMLRMKPADGWDTDMPQIIQDLHGLKISSTASDTVEHICEPTDIDKPTALEILDIVMIHVNRLSLKDLLKSDLRFAVDKLQQCIKVPKLADNTGARSFNKRLVNVYLRTPINPVDLYRSLRGVGGLGSTPATTSGWDIAGRGWYFLLGHIALFKFKSQKRTTPGSIEDLENAKVFFKLDLEYDTEKWETWYRLAQVFDALLDEQTTWTAEKLDPKSASLVELQRHAILSYNMALAIAGRLEGASFEDVSKMADLQKDFALRLYSSSREPFCGEAFSLSDYERPYNNERGMYKKPPFSPLTPYRAWKFASALLQQASLQKPNDWFLFYSLAKMQWKIYQTDATASKGTKPLPYQSIIISLTRAIESLPDKRDGRHSEKDPVLEPHYKLLSIVHKLVHRNHISAREGCLLLKATPYARRVPSIQDPEDWIDYMQEILKALRCADKSNWYHRMVFRAASTIYETDVNDIRTWLGARHELFQQIFTKTMTIQVWKPEHERSGRHFVYTSRYVAFLLEILQKLKDKDNVEALAKRIRKKSGDFFRHGEVWQRLFNTYLAMIRERVEHQVGAKLERGFDDIYFKNHAYDDFQTNAARIEGWINNPSFICGEVESLRDAIEFKKINNKLIKDSVVEETIADIYAAIYAKYAEQLKTKETAEENRVRMRVDNILVNPVPASNGILQPDVSFDSNASAQDQTTSRRRFNIITHREVIRRAEALMTKPPPIATPKPANKTLPFVPTEQGKSPGIAVVIRQPSTPTKDEFNTPAGSPRSLHDSADDESELSDVEDEGAGYETAQEEEEENAEDGTGDDVEGDGDGKPKPPLFPNLFGGHVRGGGIGGEVEVGSEGVAKTATDTETEKATYTEPPEQVEEKEDMMDVDAGDPANVSEEATKVQQESGQQDDGPAITGESVIPTVD